MTKLEATAELYRAQLYCLHMADRQRNDERRRDYNDAARMLRTEREALDKLDGDVLADILSQLH